MSEEHVRRMHTIVSLRRRGYSYRKIGEAVGLSVERTRQIIAYYNNAVRKGRIVGKEVG